MSLTCFSRRLPLGGRHLGPQGGSVGHAIEPVAEHVARTHRGRFVSQDEKRRLKGVLDIVAMAQDAKAHAVDHPAMAPHQGLKRGRILVGDEALQQLAIRQAGAAAQHGPAQMLDDRVRSMGCHFATLTGFIAPIYHSVVGSISIGLF